MDYNFLFKIAIFFFGNMVQTVFCFFSQTASAQTNN